MNELQPTNPLDAARAHLLAKYDSRMNLSVKELATEIGMSEDFVRLRTADQRITTISFGDRIMIPLDEAVRVIVNGVE